MGGCIPFDRWAGGARNVGLLAVRILAAGDGPLGERLRGEVADFQVRLADEARAKGAALAARMADPA